MLIALAVITLCAGLAFVLVYPLTPGFLRRPGRHRGTPSQLMLQEAQHNRNAVVADFMEYGWTREQAEAQL